MASLQDIQSISVLNQEAMLLQIEAAGAQEIGTQEARCMMLLVRNVEIHARFHLSQDKEGLFFVVIALEKQNLEMTDTKEMTDNQEMTVTKEMADPQEIGMNKDRCMMLLVRSVEIHARFHLSQDKEGMFFVVIALEQQNLEMTVAQEMTATKEMADAQEIGMNKDRCMMLLVRNVEIHARFHLSQDKEGMFFVVIALEQQNQEITVVLVVGLLEEIEEKELVMILLEKRKTTLKEVQIRFMQTCEKNYLRF